MDGPVILRFGLCLLAFTALISALRLWPAAQTLAHAAGPVDADAARFLIWGLRVPRILAALIAGGAFGLAGALLQAVMRNPLAAPDLLGVTAGAEVGLLLGIAFPIFAAISGPPLLFLCSLAATTIAIAAAGGWRAAPLRLLLAGGACSLLLGSLVTLTLALFEQNIAGVAFWSTGSLYQPGAEGLMMAALWLVPSLMVIPFLIRPLAVLSLGDDAAVSLGVAIDPLRFVTVIAATALTAVAVAIAGPIGFVGLLAPNLIRAAGIYDLAAVCGLSAGLGAALLLAADSAVAGLGLSAGLSTTVAVALVGTPLLLALVLRDRGLTPVDRSALDTSEAARRPFLLVLVTLAIALVALTAFGLVWGQTWLMPNRWLSAFQGDDRTAALVLSIRAPRIVVAGVAGAMLAASGTILQSVVRNALAGPELLGVTQGAALTTLTGLLVWPSIDRPGLFGLALTGGLATLALILVINRRRDFAPLPVALTGLALSGLFGALTYALIVETSAQPARSLVWLVGGTYGRAWVDAAALSPWLIAAVPALVLLARPLDILTLGDDAAAGLGVRVGLLRGLALTLGAALASVSVAITGPIAFVGLLAPHFARLIGFHTHGRRLPVAMLLGALLTVAADIIGRAALAPHEIPAGALTALLGAPYFLWLLARRQSNLGASR